MSFMNIVKGVAVVTAVSTLAYTAARAYNRTVKEIKRQEQEAKDLSDAIEATMATIAAAQNDLRMSAVDSLKETIVMRFTDNEFDAARFERDVQAEMEKYTPPFQTYEPSDRIKRARQTQTKHYTDNVIQGNFALCKNAI